MDSRHHAEEASELEGMVKVFKAYQGLLQLSKLHREDSANGSKSVHSWAEKSRRGEICEVIQTPMARA
jgi:hypothetical protein